jgi:hypothetical protein
VAVAVVTLTRRKPKSWTCPKCHRKNEARTSSRTCQYGCGTTKPKKRPSLAKPSDSYDVYELLSVTIHGGEPGACGVCGRPPKERRNNDRDHDHRTGKPRGLACPRCNKELLRHSTLEEARAIVAYLERVERWYLDAE